ncbi:MAG: GNAT family protein [Nitrososphaerales archaeon]|jgi:RimJ/RimL family protein N-acetyltransferase
MKRGRVYATFTARGGRRVVLRALRRTDLDGLLKFANAIVKERRTNLEMGIVSLDKRVRRSDEKKFLERILLGIRRKEVISVAAFVGEKVVGNCDISRRRLTDIRHTGLFGIVILDGYRGIGIGQMMVKTALEEAFRGGVWLVELDVFAINEVAIHVYEKLGFKKAGVVPDKMLRHGRLLDEIHMYVDLRKRVTPGMYLQPGVVRPR